MSDFPGAPQAVTRLGAAPPRGRAAVLVRPPRVRGVLLRVLRVLRALRVSRLLRIPIARGGLIGLVALHALASPPVTVAQSGATEEGDSSHASSRSTPSSVSTASTAWGVGDSTRSLPGVHLVGVAEETAPGVGIAGALGYGYTESVLYTDDTHHRYSGTVAASIRPARWFAASLELGGRYDTHANSPGSDSGFTGDTTVHARLAQQYGRALVGLHTSLNATPKVGSSSFSPDTLSVSAVGLLGYRFEFARQALTLASQWGYKFDQSGNAATNADQLSRADRLALGVSDFNAVMMGVAAVWHLGRVDVMAEWAYNLLVGAGAPSASVSPMYVNGGVRWYATDNRQLQLQLLITGSPSSRPIVDVGEPLVVVEPRLGALLGVTYHWPWQSASRSQTREPSTAEPPAPTKPATAPGTSQAPAAAPTAMLHGTVTDERGAPVPSALVEVTIGTKTFSTLTDDKGYYQLRNLPTGQATLRVHADGYEDSAGMVGTVVTVTAVDPATDARSSSRDHRASQGTRAALRVKRVVEKGQIRGLVRSFDGRIVPAAVRVEPLGVEATTDSEGSFHVDVQPGSYQVRVRAKGYVEQTRRVVVEEDGVTVLNVDLRRQRGAKRSRK